MLTYDNLMHAPVDKLRTTVDEWTATIRKLTELRDDIHETVLKPIQVSGWQGDDAAAGIRFTDETAQEFEDAVTEATGIRDILDEACTAIEDQKKELQRITDEVAPSEGVRVTPEGKVFPQSTGPGADLTYGDEMERIQHAIEKALVYATEADEKAAYALKGNVDEAHDFGAPEHATLAESQAAQSESRFRRAEDFMYREMMKNIESDRVENIRDQLDTSEWHDVLPNPALALGMWFEQVHSGGDWDHKPILEDKLNLESKDEFNLKVPGQNRTASYDMWSNIHYGYVGAATGIPPNVLITGASISEPGVGGNDSGDQITMRAGIELYQEYGDDLTKEQFHQKVMETVDKMEEEGSSQVQEWEPKSY